MMQRNEGRPFRRLLPITGLAVFVNGLAVLGPPPSVHAATLSFLEDTAIAFLEQADRKLQQEAALRALESDDPRAAQEWKNSASGYSGRVQSLGNFHSDDGLECRKLRIWIQARGVESEFVFPFCKEAGGEWFIASGKRLVKAEE